MSNVDSPRSSDQIIARFNALRKARERSSNELITLSEEAERAQRREVVTQAAGYTVESIVNGLASLQLEFGGELDTISNRLQSESDKLDLLKRAIVIERERLSTLQDIQVAAEARALLSREQARERANFESSSDEERAALASTRAAERAQWAEEQSEHEAGVSAFEELRARGRAQAEEAYAYEARRQRKRDADTHTSRQSALERALAESSAKKEADWTAREARLTANAELLASLRGRVAELPDELEEAIKAARAQAIREASENAAVEAELLQKEHEADVKVFELRVQTLERTLTRQLEQLTSLTEQLQVSASQSQDLAVKAIDGSARGPRA